MSLQTTVKGNWHEFKGILQENWGKITDNELDRIDGKKEKFIGMVMKKYSMREDDARRAVARVWHQYE